MPRGASGISWSGDLDRVQEQLKHFDLNRENILFFATLSALVVFVLLVGILVKRHV